LVESALMANQNVETIFSAAGTSLSLRGSTTALVPYQGSVTVKLKDARQQSTSDVIKAVRRDLAKIPGIRVLVTPYDLVTLILTGGATNMEVDVFGQNLADLTASSRKVMDAMRGVPGLESVDVAVQEASPELQWKVDRQKAQVLGVSFSDIAAALANSTNGALASYYQNNGFQYPIYVQVPENQRKTVSELLNLPVETDGAGGRPRQITLSQVATPEIATGPNEITRLDRQRYVAVTGTVTDRSESEVQADVSKALGKLSLPAGMHTDFGQQQQRRAEEFAGLGVAVFMAIALIYMLLASQFESFIYPLVILTSVPVCAVGVVLGLLLTGKPFGLTAFIGLLMLIGIVVKNGILLVDYTNQLRGRGMARDDAILTASPTRLRPILMTSCAAILGMLPLAIGFGKGSETEQPLAIAVIGGLTTSTILTLFIVPVVYTWFDDIGRRLRKDRRDLAPSLAVGPTPAAVGPTIDPNAPEPTPPAPGSGVAPAGEIHE
jgi:HAE1 family hydrophobic/amphiphilic exporter-1